MQGNNPIRAPEQGDGRELGVKNIFPTLQGEGPFAGHPAVFVRLGGCNLACAFCDTDFEGFATMRVEDIIEKVQTLSLSSSSFGLTEGSPTTARDPSPKKLKDWPKDDVVKRVRHLAVITGGEPLRQNIAPLCAALLAEGFRVQIETNGTLWRPLPEAVDIVCSPKNTGQGYFPMRGDLLKRVDAFKFIISQHDENYNHVGDVGQSVYHTPVYVQPMDEYDATRNAENLALALELATRHGYRLSLQVHKMLGIE